MDLDAAPAAAAEDTRPDIMAEAQPSRPADDVSAAAQEAPTRRRRTAARRPAAEALAVREPTLLHQCSGRGPRPSVQVVRSSKQAVFDLCLRIRSQKGNFIATWSAEDAGMSVIVAMLRASVHLRLAGCAIWQLPEASLHRPAGAWETCQTPSMLWHRHRQRAHPRACG